MTGGSAACREQAGQGWRGRGQIARRLANTVKRIWEDSENLARLAARFEEASSWEGAASIRAGDKTRWPDRVRCRSHRGTPTDAMIATSEMAWARSGTDPTLPRRGAPPLPRKRRRFYGRAW